MKPVGGFFELELSCQKEYHNNAIKVNTGHNAFEYILRGKKYSKVWMPFFICDIMLEPLQKLNINYEFYRIDNDFLPCLDLSQLDAREVLLYVNYYGICDKNVETLIRKGINIIIDNSQAFFAKPHPSIDTFYSPRKFFGIPDGGYLYCNITLKDLPLDKSADRFRHLLDRIDSGPQNAYRFFIENESHLRNLELRHMSKLTRRILGSINYESVVVRRRENFTYMHKNLSKINELPLSVNDDSVPMVYPLLSYKPGLRDLLIRHNIFVPKFWPNVLEWTGINSIEYRNTENILPLPIDQRYSPNDLRIILTLIGI